MKLIVKLTLVVGTLTAIGTSVTLADDQHLQCRLAQERAQISPRLEQTTVAVYANRQGMGQADASASDSDYHFELRSNGHGQLRGDWVR